MYAEDSTLFNTYHEFENIDDKIIETIQNNINKELLLTMAWLHSNRLLIETTKHQNDNFSHTST